jgi:hypothetical protein
MVFPHHPGYCVVSCIASDMDIGLGQGPFSTLADSLPILISKSESKTTPGCQRSIVISGLLVDHNASE